MVNKVLQKNFKVVFPAASLVKTRAENQFFIFCKKFDVGLVETAKDIFETQPNCS